MNEPGDKVADVRLGVRLTANEKHMLDELTQRRYPGRKRMHSVVLAEIIRAAYDEIEWDNARAKANAQPQEPPLTERERWQRKQSQP